MGLDLWTEHGKYEVVPNVKGLSYARASEILRNGNLVAELSDSIYDDSVAPGTVVEQTPRMNDKVKPRRTIYLTINAFSPKSVTLPDLSGLSLRQAQSALESYGFKNIRISHIPSEYKDLVLGANFNGAPLHGGARVPVSATITLEVGAGYVPTAVEADSVIEEEVDIDNLDLSEE